MNIYILIIVLYLVGLTIMNFWKSRKVQSQDDMMLAGRSISMTKMVFTLICTWIGSGTFISGAEFAAKAGWSALWQVGGVAVGIVIIYFLAAKIRTFGQYTVGDILEVRYGPVARVFGAIAIVISFTTIVSYQFKAGGYILKTISDGALSDAQGMFFAFLFVTIFTMIGGMVAIANTDLPNGIIILTAMIVSTPLVIIAAGSFSTMAAVLPATHLQVFNPEFTYNPPMKILAIAISTFLLLLGVQSMYQKFYSAKTPQEARKAAGIWVIGTIFIETVAVVMAIFASVHFWDRLQAGQLDHAEVIVRAAREMIPMPVGVLLLGAATVVVISTGMNYLLSPTTTLIRDIIQRFSKSKQKDVVRKSTAEKNLLLQPKVIAAAALFLSGFLTWFKSESASYLGVQVAQFIAENTDMQFSIPAMAIVFKLLVYLIPVFGIGMVILTLAKLPTKVTALVAGLIPFAALGILLTASKQALSHLGVGVYLAMVAGLALIIYRDTERAAAEKKVVFLQQFLIVLVGVFAYLMATQMTSVLENAYFAYTIYGVAITPALLAALAWKRVTKIAGLVSIVSATVVTLFLKIAGYVWPGIMKPAGDPNADPFGIPLLYPALVVALVSLVGISYITKPPSKEVLARFFPDGKEA
ncbi:MAG: sodium:solute symporter family protein [Candidatus Zhuqueibacterota bacterium]